MPYAIKPFEELEFCDDFMFFKVMQDDEICKELIERLLKIKIDHIKRPELQKEIRPYYHSKGVKLDVYLKDSMNIYDVEMQNVTKEALPKRLRYYQSMVDADALLRGEDYTALNDSHIIFLCTTDPMGRGLPVYTFLETCCEDSDILLNDGTHKYFFNATAAELSEDVEIRAVLDYIMTKNASDMFTEKIARFVDKVKADESAKGEYMIESLAIQDSKREGRKEGIEIGLVEGERKKAIEAARNLKENGVDIQLIAKCVGLSVEEIQKL
ncbi:MAG: Rpn family recombination-promoting nuclease/putative transposase [Spirochaetaceae bacterium]|nr:Rpn family recombination-promoting nuclease/putative transposase [Spirochaetaceae bacterium]